MFSLGLLLESDYLLINWEKDNYCTNLTDLSLEGILHCKQYFELLGVANEMKYDIVLIKIEDNRQVSVVYVVNVPTSSSSTSIKRGDGAPKLHPSWHPI